MKLVVFLLLAASGCRPKDAVARVNDHYIVQAQVEEEVRPVLLQLHSGGGHAPVSEDDKQRQMALARLIERLIFRDKAKTLGVTVSPQEINDVREMRRQQGGYTLESYAAFLKAMGVTLDAVNDAIEAELLRTAVGKHLVGAWSPSEDEIVAYYEAHRSDYTEPSRMIVRKIVTYTEASTREKASAKISAAAAAARAGADFNVLQRKYSDEPDVADRGAFHLVGTGPREVEEALEKLQEGRVSEVVETAGRFWLLKLEQRVAEKTASLGEIRQRVRLDMIEQVGGKRLREAEDVVRADARVERY